MPLTIVYTVVPLTVGGSEEDGWTVSANAPAGAVMVAHNRTAGEGLLVCRGIVSGTPLADRDAAVAKFIELMGRAPIGRELP
jgi:hypothetical protein